MSCFNCKKCGSCCSNYLPLSKSEKAKLKNIVKTRKLKPIERPFDSYPGLTCPFLDNNNKCSIYEDRPLICKNYTCQKFITNDFSDSGELLKEERLITDIRKEIF